nr:hypothetical protein [Tanacetum cinerariifolium]
ELEEKLEREAQRMNAQIAKDEEIAKIHAEEELKQMIEGGVFKISEGEAAWLKRKGIRSEQESAKKQKTSEEVPEEVKSSDEVPEEKIKELIRLVPIEEVDGCFRISAGGELMASVDGNASSGSVTGFRTSSKVKFGFPGFAFFQNGTGKHIHDLQLVSIAMAHGVCLYFQEY